MGDREVLCSLKEVSEMKTPTSVERTASLEAACYDVLQTTGVNVSKLVTADDVTRLHWITMLEMCEPRFDERANKLHLPGYGTYMTQDVMMRLSSRLYAARLNTPEEERLCLQTVEHVKRVFYRRFLWHLRGWQVENWQQFAARTAVALAREIVLPSVPAARHNTVLWAVWRSVACPGALNLSLYLHDIEGVPHYIIDTFNDEFLTRRRLWTD